MHAFASWCIANLHTHCTLHIAHISTGCKMHKHEFKNNNTDIEWTKKNCLTHIFIRNKCFFFSRAISLITAYTSTTALSVCAFAADATWFKSAYIFFILHYYTSTSVKLYEVCNIIIRYINVMIIIKYILLYFRLYGIKFEICAFDLTGIRKFERLFHTFISEAEQNAIEHELRSDISRRNERARCFMPYNHVHIYFYILLIIIVRVGVSAQIKIVHIASKRCVYVIWVRKRV